jgi:hypothetical protein
VKGEEAMKENVAMMMIAVTECLRTISEAQGIEDRLKASMKLAKNHWLVTDEDERFKAAVGAVMQSYGPGSPEWTQLETELKALAQVSSMINSAQVGLSVGLDSIELPPEDFKPIGLLRMWRETE